MIGLALVLGIVLGVAVVLIVLGWLVARYFLSHSGDDNQ